MNWIVDRSGLPLVLNDDANLLNYLGQFDEGKLQSLVQKLKDSIGSLYSDVSNIKSPFELLELFSQDKQFKKRIKEIIDMHNALGINTIGLPEIVDKFKNWVDIIPDEYKKLLQPVGDFVETEADTDPGLVKWVLLAQEGDKKKQLDMGLVLKLSGEADAALHFEAGHKSPFESDTADYLRIGLVGNADIKASASVPLPLGSFSFGAGADGNLHLNYLFTISDKNIFFARAVGRSLGSLANPMDLNSLWENTINGNLQGMTVKADGSSYVNVSIGLAKRADIPEVVTIGAGLSIEAEIRVGGSYRFNLRKRTDSYLDLSLTRSRHVTKASGIGLSVVINAKQLAERLKDEFADNLGELNEQFENIQKYLTPGELVRSELVNKIEELVSDEMAQKLLKLGFGLTDQREVEGKLLDIVEGVINSRAATWDSSAEHAAKYLFSELSERYPILSESEIETKLQNLLREAVSKVSEKLKSEIDQLSMDGILKSLEKSGVHVNKTLNDVDRALAGVRSALKEYHEKVEKILNGLERIATSDIKFDFSTQSETTDGSSFMLRSSFTANTDETQKVYRDMLSGNLNKVLEYHATQPSGVTIELEEVQRIAQYKRKSGWSLSILDINLGAETVFSTKTTISIDEAGEIGVLSKGEWQRRRKAYRESREFGFVNSYKLLTAKYTKRFTAGIKLSQVDEKTEKNELKNFLERLEEHKLVAQGTGASAESILEEWGGQADNGDVATKITASMKLTQVELGKLMLLGASQEKLRDEYFVQVAYSAHKQIGLITQSDINNAVTALRDMSGVKTDKLDPEELIAKYTEGQRRELLIERYYNNIDVMKSLNKIARLNDKAMALKDLIYAMRAIWDADPSDSSIDEFYYRDKQKIIDDSLRIWIKIGSTFIFWLSDEVHHSTIAFLLATTYLSGININSRAPLSVRVSQEGGDSFDLPYTLNE